jgi:predicted negative regulator of RcsB-dependent stress response
VLLDEKNPAEALKVLESKHGDSFAGLYADVKGDALLAGGQRTEARAAYQIALDKSDAASPLRQIIQLKLDALGESK